MNFNYSLSTKTWALIACTAGAAVLSMTLNGFSLSWRSAALPFLGIAVLESVAWFYRNQRPDPRIATALDCVAQLIAFSAVGCVLSYVIASADRPLWDTTLFSWDRALGSDWRAYLAFVNARPWLGQCFSAAYGSLMVQWIVVPLALSFGDRFQACREFVLAFIVAAVIAILISGFMPALGAYVLLGLEQARDYPNLRPMDDFVHVPDLLALRAGTLRGLSLWDPKGLIGFPSFHASLGVLFAAALWKLRWLRWPGLALNVVLIASTPIDGGHYFVDVIAGIAIACGALAFARSFGSQPEMARELSREGQRLAPATDRGMPQSR